MGRLVIGIAFAVALTVAAGIAPAGAAPNGPPFPPPPCQFALSVQNTGAVTAMVQSTGCAALAVPYSSVACLQPSDGAMSCVQAHGAEPAQVVLPYRPGVVFTATGRGCAGWVGLPPASDCQLLGPNAVAR
jgi:hypothetical protein